MADPRGFLKISRKSPTYRPVQERLRDWREVGAPLSLSDDEHRAQATRCMDCGVPFCQADPGCPLENRIPDWNALVSDGRWEEALAQLHETNNFPEFTGKLCPAPCESACVLGINADPVSIRAIESSIIEKGFAQGWVTPRPAAQASGRRVAVIGSGPAGLAAAQELARRGHEVTVFEKAAEPGGLLRYGIPDFKMEKSVLERRLVQLRAEGVRFITGVEAGRDLSARDLLARYEAVALTLGAETPRDVAIPGRDLQGIHFAMEFLTEQNLADSARASRLSARGKRVVILGGGDTGSDCLGTALRQGASEVTQLELLPRPGLERDASTPWPLWPMKLRSSHAHEEGGKREWSILTTEFLGQNGRLRALRAVRIEWSKGKWEAIGGGEFEIQAELLLLAAGFTGPVRSPLLTELMELGLQLDHRGNIRTDQEYRTSAARVFASGDARRGASLIVWAIAEGRRMAQAIHDSLKPLNKGEGSLGHRTT